MKLPLSEIKTNCEKCSFAIFKNDSQIGCKAGRLEKFHDLKKSVEHSENDKKWFILKRFCNMYREKEKSVQEARNEVKLSFGIMIYDNFESDSLESLDSIKELDYDKDKLKIIFITNSQKDISHKASIIQGLINDGFDAQLILNFEESLFERTAFIKCIGLNYVLKLNTDQKISNDFISKIDKSLNDDLETVLMFECQNVACFPFWFVNQEYLNYNSFDNMIDGLREKTTNANMYKKYA